MQNAQSAQEYIDQVVARQKPDVNIICIHNYQQSGDVRHLDKISADLNYGSIYSLIEIAVTENLTTPASNALFDAAVHRIVNGDYTKPDMFPAVYGLAGVRAADTDPANKVIEKLLLSLRDRGVEDFRVALFWMNNMSRTGPAAFLWNQDYMDDSALLHPEKYFELPSDIRATNGFEELIIGLSDANMLRLFKCFTSAVIEYGTVRWSIGPLQAIVARDRPQILSEFLNCLSSPDKPAPGFLGRLTGKSSQLESMPHAVNWSYVVGATNQFDSECLKYCKDSGIADPIIILAGLRGGKYEDLASEACMSYQGEMPRNVMAYLANRNQALVVEKLAEVIATSGFDKMATESRISYCKVAADNWESGGRKVYERCEFKALFDEPVKTHASSAGQIRTDLGRQEFKREALLYGAIRAENRHKELDQWLLDLLHESAGSKRAEEQIRKSLWAAKPYLLEDEIWQCLQSRLKTERRAAAESLNHISIDNVPGKIEPLLNGARDARLGAVELLSEIGDDSARMMMLAALKQKQAPVVRVALTEGLESIGHELSPEELLGDQSASDVLNSIEKAKVKRLPKSVTEWINLQELPELVTLEGSVLSEKAITQMIVVQAKHKTITPAPDNRVLFGLIDPAKSGEFSLALLNQWLRSSCDTKDKWVMALAGLLGDRRILPALTDPIQRWGEDARHKLAEYAVLAVSLVPTNDALMLLDLLANRYRSRFRNIGKACRKALEQAAITQKVSMDELADIIVPTLDFDNNYQRVLPDCEIMAVLQPDFKITYRDTATDKETKTAPKSLPDSAKKEITVIKKLITTTVKQQTVRLEQALVRQRAWRIMRWQQLFEVNPFLQSYASRLIWSTLDEAGQQAKLFRRYPNGLLADANGELIEFDDTDVSVVLLHPINLADDKLQIWREHLQRMKIKPPFAQLDRPVATLPGTHGNRKSITLTDQHQMPCGTLRSRTEKRGWARSSGEGAAITSYCKVYVNSGISVFLLMNNGYIGQDPTETVTLGECLFVSGEQLKEHNYYTGEPNNSEADNILTFGEVPAVLYSETITDLQTIIA